MMEQQVNRRWRLVLGIAVLCGAIFFLQSEWIAERFVSLQDVVAKTGFLRAADTKTRVPKPSADEDELKRSPKGKSKRDDIDKAACSTSCPIWIQEQTMKRGGDLTNITEIGRLVKDARLNLINRLKSDYGTYNYAKIFQVDGKSRGRSAFVSATTNSTISVKRFKRKLKFKVLTMQQAVREEQAAVGGCDCNTGTPSRRDSQHTLAETGDNTHSYARFVWATGGHSAAAGHGNLFNETYTSYLEQAVSDIFGAVGIEFEGRNYAMGGMASGPEIALCSEAFFGTDADVITWDYGMTDGDEFYRQAIYEQRIGINPNRPTVLGINIDGAFFQNRRNILQRVEDRGLSAMYLNPEAMSAMTAAIPDTFGLTGEQINALPPLVRHFKCQNTIEKGDPTCDEYKYTNAQFCPDRSGMASWHPGWKMHALWGNTFALFLSDILVEAIAEIGVASNPSELLGQLRKEEDDDYEKFFKPALPDPEELRLVPVDADLLDSANVSVFFRSPSICRTGLLPSQSRYLGLTTESKQTGVHDYYKGVSFNDARKMVSNKTSTPMPLVYDESEREDCEFEVVRDFKDFFFVSSKMGWTTLTIPNEAEKREYGRNSEALHGVILLCFYTCPWDQCPEGTIVIDSIVNGTVQIEVNNQPVTNVTDFRRCSLLRGENGHRFKANKAGQLDVRMKIPDTGPDLSFMRITSIAVF